MAFGELIEALIALLLELIPFLCEAAPNLLDLLFVSFLAFFSNETLREGVLGGSIYGASSYRIGITAKKLFYLKYEIPDFSEKSGI
ncbi:hypothetical protein [Nostoc sp. CCY 9925]|uniref:hypothetical protein n=1 Tax=Nostoc sp. CCY 9925 TaxID=3103865 RepID=UPI0039C6F9A4